MKRINFIPKISKPQIYTVQFSITPLYTALSRFAHRIDNSRNCTSVVGRSGRVARARIKFLCM